MFSSSTASGCLFCPDCSNNTQQGTAPTLHLSGPAAILQAEYSRLCRMRGPASGCAACASLFAQVQPVTATVAMQLASSNNSNGSSRYPTDPLPQQQLKQQQQQPWEHGTTSSVRASTVGAAHCCRSVL
jgi:hypothetical protein